MSGSAVHRWLGLILVLPVLGWLLTGLVFLIKPGYEGAYQRLALPTLPLDVELRVDPASGWDEVRLLRTVAGDHLLARRGDALMHLDARTLQPFAPPDAALIGRLVDQAIAPQRARYGDIVAVDGARVRTSTGVEITLDWDRLQLRQRGADTRLIDALYRIHYLQWLPSAMPNRILGVTGLLLLAGLTLLGVQLWWRGRRRDRAARANPRARG